MRRNGRSAYQKSTNEISRFQTTIKLLQDQIGRDFYLTRSSIKYFRAILSTLESDGMQILKQIYKTNNNISHITISFFRSWKEFKDTQIALCSRPFIQPATSYIKEHLKACNKIINVLISDRNDDIKSSNIFARSGKISNIQIYDNAFKSDFQKASEDISNDFTALMEDTNTLQDQAVLAEENQIDMSIIKDQCYKFRLFFNALNNKYSILFKPFQLHNKDEMKSLLNECLLHIDKCAFCLRPDAQKGKSNYNPWNYDHLSVWEKLIGKADNIFKSLFGSYINFEDIDKIDNDNDDENNVNNNDSNNDNENENDINNGDNNNNENDDNKNFDTSNHKHSLHKRRKHRKSKDQRNNDIDENNNNNEPTSNEYNKDGVIEKQSEEEDVMQKAVDEIVVEEEEEDVSESNPPNVVGDSKLEKFGSNNYDPNSANINNYSNSNDINSNSNANSNNFNGNANDDMFIEEENRNKSLIARLKKYKSLYEKEKKRNERNEARIRGFNDDEEALIHLRENNTLLNSENIQLKAKIKELENDISRLKSIFLNNSKDDYMNKRSTNVFVVDDDLKQEYMKVNKENSEKSIEIEKLRSTISQLEANLKKSSKMAEIRGNEEAEQKERIDNLLQQLKASDEEIMRLKNQVEKKKKYKQDLIQSDERIKELNQILLKKENDLANLKLSIEKINKMNLEAKMNSQKYSNIYLNMINPNSNPDDFMTIEKARAQVVKISSEKVKKEEEIRLLKKDIATHEGAKEDLNRQIKLLKENESALLDELKNKDIQISNLNQKLSDTNASLTSMNTIKRNLQQSQGENEKLKQKIEQLNLDNTKLNEKVKLIETFQAKLDESDAKVKKKKQKIAKLKQQIQTKDLAIAQLKETIRNTKETLNM